MVKQCWENGNTQRLPILENIFNKKIPPPSVIGGCPRITKHKNIFWRTLRATKEIFLEYFSESSIHGFKYIGNQKRPIWDRIIWSIALFLSFLTCCFLITNVWNRRDSNPVIIAFNEKRTTVWETPFPSVTICAETKTRTDMFNFTEVYWKWYDQENITENEKFYWEAISQTCQETVNVYGNVLANSSNLIEALWNAAPKLNETFLRCFWRYEEVECENFFDSVVTEEGICFNFNSLKANYYRDELWDVFDYQAKKVSTWNSENAYIVKGERIILPILGTGTGQKESLRVLLLDNKNDEDFMCQDMAQGFKVTIHSLGDELRVSKNFIRIPHGTSVSIALAPKIATTSEGLRHYEANRRQCYFEDERYLRYFKVYTQVNCELECLSNRTLEKCGCVKFSMPRNASHPVCGAKSVACISSIESSRFVTKFAQGKLVHQFDDTTSCNCLPTCVSIHYKAEVEHQVGLDYAPALRAYKGNDILNKNPGGRITLVTISFKEEVFSTLKRSELYSTTDFIANCGGLLGLFMGVSILSLVELVYFFTIRLCARGESGNV